MVRELRTSTGNGQLGFYRADLGSLDEVSSPATPSVSCSTSSPPPSPPSRGGCSTTDTCRPSPTSTARGPFEPELSRVVSRTGPQRAWLSQILPVSKAVRGGSVPRGFESLPLRCFWRVWARSLAQTLGSRRATRAQVHRPDNVTIARRDGHRLHGSEPPHPTRNRVNTPHTSRCPTRGCGDGVRRNDEAESRLPLLRLVRSRSVRRPPLKRGRRG
jgi:hypothetical protein